MTLTVGLLLEGEMYQLSHMLTEQKSLLNTMKDMSVVSDKGGLLTTIIFVCFVG